MHGQAGNTTGLALCCMLFDHRTPRHKRTSHGGASIAQCSTVECAAAAAAAAVAAAISPEPSVAPAALLASCLQCCSQQQAAGGQQRKAGEPGGRAHGPCGLAAAAEAYHSW